MEKRKKEYSFYLFAIFLFLICSFTFLYLGNYYLEKIIEMQNNSFIYLNEKIDKNYLELKKELFEKDVKINETKKSLDDLNFYYNFQIGKLNQRINDLRVETRSFSKIIEETIDSVVNILTDQGQGSGVIISPNGYVITNYHVIKGARRANVATYSDSLYSVELVAFDPYLDLALLRLVSNETFDYLEFGNSDYLERGQKVIALGNPLGLSFTASEGIISSPARIASDGLSYIQLDIAVNPGNSGGPIINSEGKIVGIINFKIAGYEGLSFAIPSNRVKEFVKSNLKNSSLF
ncbi:MAG: S1C family serine protease [Candidatus Pacearchaeota archaeon]